MGACCCSTGSASTATNRSETDAATMKPSADAQAASAELVRTTAINVGHIDLPDKIASAGTPATYAEPRTTVAEPGASAAAPAAGVGATTPSASANSGIAPLGIHIEVLQTLLIQARRRRHRGLTTKYVCDKIVKPATSARQCPYIDLLANQTSTITNRPLVAAATVFVSHAWKYDFAMVVEVLEQIAEEKPNTYFWFDLVINNQHKTQDRPFEWWCSTFKDSIRGIGKVVLILSPWNDPIPLTRAWCLWEIFSAATIDEVGFECRLPEGEKPSFREAIGRDYKAVMDTLVRVQVERSEAYSTVDRDNIFNAIKQSCGTAHLNERVKDQLREWLLRVAVEMAEEMILKGEHGVKAAYFYENVGTALKVFGELNKALVYYEQALAIELQELGADHRNVGVNYNNTGLLYEAQGQYAQALEYYGKSLKIRLAALGEQHTDTGDTWYNMALVHQSNHNWPSAVKCFTKAHAVYLGTYGREHKETVDAANRLAEARSYL